MHRRGGDEYNELVGVLKARARRAMAAYWKSPVANHPPEDVTHVLHDGLDYVQLSAPVVGVLALYRVLNDGQLKRLRRWPDFSDHGTRSFPDDELA
jgi:hypothetical protein